MAFLRFLLFAALLVALVFGAEWLAGRLGHGMRAGDHMAPGVMLHAEAIFAACAVAANVIMKVLGRQPWSTTGIGGRDRPRHLGLGLVVGVGAMSGLLAVLALLGVLTFGPVTLSSAAALSYGLAYVTLFLLTGIAEEGTLRAFALSQLSRAIAFWPAAVILSALFGLAHMTNGGENPMGLITAGVFGLVAAWSFQRTGGLWFAVGLHAAWDFMETFVFGVPNSGIVAPGSLTHATVSGPVALSGGSAGPEGSWLALVALAAIALIVWRMGRKSV